jgi:hypothetical protein
MLTLILSSAFFGSAVQALFLIVTALYAGILGAGIPRLFRLLDSSLIIRRIYPSISCFSSLQSWSSHHILTNP